MDASVEQLKGGYIDRGSDRENVECVHMKGGARGRERARVEKGSGACKRRTH